MTAVALRTLGSVLALAYAAATMSVTLGGEVPTTYSVTLSLAALADFAAGTGLIAVGVAALWQRGTTTLAAVTILLGAVWLAPDWVGWEEGGSPLARSLGMAAAPFLGALLAHLVLIVPIGRRPVRAERAALAALYALTAVYSVGRALLRDPFTDVDCWSNCTDNVFLVTSLTGVDFDVVWLWITIPVFVLIAFFAVRRLRDSPVLVAASVAAVACAVHATVLLSRGGAEDPGDGLFEALFVTRALAFTAIAATVGLVVADRRRKRRAVVRVAADVGAAPAPGQLRAALARRLGDDELEIAYWLPGAGRYVDAHGRPTSAEPPAGRTATAIVRDEAPVALVLHDASHAADLEPAIGAAARLAIDNERLRAQGLAQLQDLRASSARTVATGDAARKRMERDLHDGAQQRLLAASFALRQASAESPDEAILQSAGEDVRLALEELRAIAHGIYPMILAEAGLGPALESLADEAPVAVVVGELPPARLPEAAERAAYAAAAAGIAAATGDRVDVTAHVADGELRLCAGPVAAVGPVDRVIAMGGAISVTGDVLEARIPCG